MSGASDAADAADAADDAAAVTSTQAGPADVAGLAGVAGLAEPVALRDAWWAAERAGEQPPDLVASVADLAWAAWGARLPGAKRAWLDAVVAGHRRELWLWLAGERTWEQALTSLAGRARRRLPA